MTWLDRHDANYPAKPGALVPVVRLGHRHGSQGQSPRIEHLAPDDQAVVINNSR
jgi:hypothetical protein